MNMKRLTSWIVTGAMVLGLSACGTNGATSDNADNSQNTSTPAITEPVDASSQTQEVEKTTPDTAETTPVSQEETPVPEEVGPKFTEVNETVYATTSVNVRASYSADSDKVGSLSAGASVTRTGVGNNGWSRIIYNGNEAYVSSDYLTTSKSSTSTPSTSKPSTSTPSTSKPSTSTPSTSTPSSGGDTLTDEEKANGEAFDQTVEDMGGYIDGGAFWVP
jgi:uncharacterized protein YgiM (DUF1202 family)